MALACDPAITDWHKRGGLGPFAGGSAAATHLASRTPSCA
jgi:hypothetical protein